MTFEEITYLVDNYYYKTRDYDFLTYGLFVTFFPHLIAGPIVHHKEITDQFADQQNTKLNYSNIARGAFLFFIGLAKKVIIADTFAGLATYGFDVASELPFFDAWVTSLSYSLQLYFDFSGYTDMAIGTAIMFNIRLPQNFNSPYKAVNIQDFWRRWHMTLSRFLKNYVYIPLGGARLGEFYTYRNLFIVFLLGGLWHGAAWTFVVWGILHGLATIIHRFWSKLNIDIPKFWAWFLTFNFVNLAWIFFRAKSFEDAFKVLGGMINLKSIVETDFQLVSPKNLILLSVFLTGAILWKNSDEISAKFHPSLLSVLITFILFFVSFWGLNNFSPFIYFNF